MCGSLELMRKRLEFHSQSNLSGPISTHARDLPETRVEHACLNPTKGMAVEGIEQFNPELSFHALAHPEGFAQADVFVAAPRIANVEREGGDAEHERFVIHDNALCHITMPSRARRDIRHLELLRIKIRIQR